MMGRATPLIIEASEKERAQCGSLIRRKANMNYFKLSSVACAASLLLAGAASATPMAHMVQGIGPTATNIAYMRKGSPAAKAKQRHRTRIDRCNKAPSRC